MAITRLTDHELCQVHAELCTKGPHFAQLVCSDHNKHIQWLSQEDFFCVTDRANINYTNNTNDI